MPDDTWGASEREWLRAINPERGPVLMDMPVGETKGAADKARLSESNRSGPAMAAAASSDAYPFGLLREHAQRQTAAAIRRFEG